MAAEDFQVDARPPVGPHPPSALPVLAAAALISASDGALMVGLPFLAISMGASAANVGLVGGVMKIIYVFGLLAGRRLLDRYDHATLTAIGCAGMALSALAMPFAQGFHGLLLAAATFGCSTSLFWPPVVGLVSAGLQGPALNRRLGRFNLTWSAGFAVGPWLGGMLYAWHASFVFWAATGFAALAMSAMLISAARAKVRQSEPRKPVDECTPTLAPSTGDPRTRLFLGMARPALVGGYLVYGLLRFQLPNLTEEIGISKAAFGAIGAALSLSLSCSFVLLGRASGWHHRLSLLWGAQLLMAVSLVIPAWSAGRSGPLFLAVVLAGQGLGLVYASHLFYGTSDGRNRARAMSAHEVLLSVGFLLGSYGGGCVAEYLGNNRDLYWAGAGAVLLLVILQVFVLLRERGPGLGEVAVKDSISAE